MGEELFRSEVAAAKNVSWLGHIVLTQPRLALALSALTFALTACLVLFLWAGEYTKKARIQGQTIPSQGLMKPTSPVAGVVVVRHVGEGAVVTAGQPLFEISSERNNQFGAPTQHEVIRHLRERRQGLTREREVQESLGKRQRDALRRKINALESESSQLRHELRTQQRRVEFSEETVRRYRELEKTQFVPALQRQQREEESLEQVSRLQMLQRTLLAADRELALVKDELGQMPDREEASISAISRSISAIDQDLLENEARKGITVVAPSDGLATGVVADVGQSVSQGQPLLSVLPKDSVLEVHLFAPSRSAGFVAEGQAVLLRYQAFPYQKFGHYGGKVRHISRTALTAVEVPPSLSGANSAAETFFRVTVALDSQSVRAYGEQHPLQAGMQLDADVLLDRRRIIEWLLEPLYSMTGRL